MLQPSRTGFGTSFPDMRMVTSWYMELKASKQKDVFIPVHDFIFNKYLNESDSSVLKTILMMNKSNVRTLITEKTSLQTIELLSIIRTSKHCLERVEIPAAPVLCNALHGSNIKELAFIGDIDASLVSNVVASMPQLTFLKLKESSLKEGIHFSVTVQCFCLFQCECSLTVIVRLFVELSALKHKICFGLEKVTLIECEAAISRAELLNIDMSKITLGVTIGSIELYNVLRDTTLGNLMLETGSDLALASDILPTLINLKSLSLCGIYLSSCDFKLPASLQCVGLQKIECSSEWLCSLLITLSSLHRNVACELVNVVLQTNYKPYGAAKEAQLFRWRSEVLSCDMSDIEIIVKTVNIELFETLRDLSIRILYLMTADCFSQASQILPTLNKLEDLYLWGTYVDQCDLKPLSTLNCVSLQEGECSFEWLCKLLIKLSLFDHPVKCEVWDFEILSQAPNLIDWYSSQLRFEMVSHDMSNVELHVRNRCIDQYKALLYVNIEIFTLD
ncbi:hypothetical protein DPMN_154188 [Dreissena polymorpha]|uniref:Uncharacterized protein n=1 Tax=Dreissena polymorpha TaxID=45954 RepID=A0A9D4J6R8_DREPO|nr:hypothetical protein DPMN_154188 [Dreissena polymorpha]